jgi:hypothetical protein
MEYFDDHRFEMCWNQRLGTNHDNASNGHGMINAPVAVCGPGNHESLVETSDYLIEYMELFPERCFRRQRDFEIGGQFGVVIGKWPVISYNPHNALWNIKERFKFYLALRRWKRWSRSSRDITKRVYPHQEWK